MDKENISVLVVEFKPEVRMIVIKLLVRFLGFAQENIVEAFSAEQALMQIKKKQFDLLITGNRLDKRSCGPIATGVDLVNEVKRLGLTMKILMITGGEKPELPKDVLFLQEPFEGNLLAGVINKALG